MRQQKLRPVSFFFIFYCPVLVILVILASVSSSELACVAPSEVSAVTAHLLQGCMCFAFRDTLRQTWEFSSQRLTQVLKPLTISQLGYMYGGQWIVI